MRIEAVLLTGGRSSRMGVDKALLDVGGEPLATRIARLLATVVSKVTVLGQKAIEGHGFVPDRAPHVGPLSALANFQPEAPLVFVCACDVPLFDPRIVPKMAERIQAHPSVLALVPDVENRLQPLLGLYRAEAFSLISTVTAEGHESLMAWLDALWVETLDDDEIVHLGLDPGSFRSANTPEEFSKLVGLTQKS